VSKRHMVIPDVQAKPGVNFDYLEKMGKYMVEKKPEVVVCIGDFADMPSLSSYDVGKKSFEGKRYVNDIAASKEAMTRLLTPLWEFNSKARKNKEKLYKPKLHLTLGNHENRINRAVNDDPKLDGVLSVDDLGYKEFGWTVHKFLDVLVLDNVAYSHYFVTGLMGRPFTTAGACLAKKHMSCVAGHQQGLQIATGYKADGSLLTSIIAGSCLTPDHKVLTSDLRYVELGSVCVGDKLVSFDEEVVNKRSRRYKTGTVEAIKRDTKEVFKVTLASGKEFKVTADHRWLVKTGSKYYWKTTNTLRKGTCIPKLFEEWEEETSYEAGWIAGMYDGEGSLSIRETTGGSCIQLAISQNEGPVLDRLKTSLDWYGFPNGTYQANGRQCVQGRLVGGAAKIAEFLGTFRPTRLLPKFKPEYLGRINSSNENNDKVVSIENVGKQEIVQIAIDAKTLIVEGYPHHNCYEHDEEYMSAQGNNHWRGFLMLHDVQEGAFDLMPVSLNYLNRKYD